jgi:ligand-binding sensor domain-containing protein/serine phosphatase RsbU (regulator of sigma subunit)
MKKTASLIILVVVLGFVHISSMAQNPRFENYKILPNRNNIQVHDIFQDSLGYIWLGTNYGLVQFDGKNFQLFGIKDSLFDSPVTALNQDFSKKMWIGHASGKIAYFNGEDFEKFQPEEGLPKKDISSFFISADSVLWFSTYGEGVYYYKGKYRKRLYNLNTDDGLIDNYIYSIVQDKNGILYFSSDLGISVYNPQNDEFLDQITMSDGLPDNIVKQMLIKGDFLWIAMEEGGISRYNLDNGSFMHFSNWNFGSINDFICLSDNELWVSTKHNGIVRCLVKEGKSIHYSKYNVELGLADNQTECLFLDRERNIWIGTKDGVSLRKNNHFEFLNEKDGFSINHIFSFTIDDDHNFWIASQEGLFKVTKSDMGELSKTKFFVNSKFSNLSFISLFKDPRGYIWAGTYGYGVFRIDPSTGEYKHLNTSHGLADNNVIHISGINEHLLFSTLGGGITHYNYSKQEHKNYSLENGLPSNYVYSTFIDSKGRIWAATDGGGAAYIQNGKVHEFGDSAFYQGSKVVYSVTEDSYGNIWFNLANSGIIGFDEENEVHYSAKNGLQTNSVQSIISDGSGYLLIISNEGIDKLSVEDSTFEYHGKEDGVAYWEPNLNASFKDSMNNVWIGTAKGIIKYNTQEANKMNVFPKIFITSTSVFFNEIEPGRREFKYDQNHLTFNYNALWFQASKNLTYRYKLAGYDIDWNPATNARMATYSNLPPGKYEFIVQVKFAGSKWIDRPESHFSFVIRPPFWKTTWFIITAIVVGLLAIYTFIRLRIRKLKRDKEVLEEEVKKRTEEIQKQKEEIEAQRDEIEAQRDSVVKQRNRIEQQNKEIKSSILYARRIQNAVLPPANYVYDKIGEHFILFKPKDIVSGDFYYLNTKNDKIIVAAADCTGHGVPGAFMSMLGTSLLNHILSKLDREFNAGEILTRLREEVKQALRQSNDNPTETKDGMDISLCVIEKSRNKLHFAGAYNPLILIRDKELIRYKGDSMPIGIHIKEKAQFTNYQIELQKDDMLYLFSDGYQDQFGGAKNRKFLPKNLRNKLLSVSDNPLEEQKAILDETFEKWKSDYPQIDDVLVLGFRV